MTFDDLVDNRIELALFCLEYNVRVIDSDNRFVGRNSDNVQLVDLSEFFFFCHSRTGHTRKLIVQTEIILICNCSNGFGFSCDFNAFFCFNSLMKSVVESSSLHYTSCKFVYDKNFSVLYNVVDIFFHNAVCLDCLIDVVEQGHIVCVHKVYNVESFFRFLYAAFGKSCGFSLFVDDVISVQQVVISLVVHFNNCNRL